MGIKHIFLFINIWAAGLQFVTCLCAYGQDTIYLKNPSFEDLPRAGTPYTPPIKDWQDCGVINFPAETPPDIHPVVKGAWGVTLPAYDGKTYLGLVVRYSGTVESVSQKLAVSIKKDSCYSFSLFMARSETYKSMTMRSRTNLENFITPAVMRIWGGNESCERKELIGQSDPVDHSEWKQYSFIMWPKETYSYITLEAYFADLNTAAYNGHILVDDLSPIIKIDCKN